MTYKITLDFYGKKNIIEKKQCVFCGVLANQANALDALEYRIRWSYFSPLEFARNIANSPTTLRRCSTVCSEGYLE